MLQRVRLLMSKIMKVKGQRRNRFTHMNQNGTYTPLTSAINLNEILDCLLDLSLKILKIKLRLSS
jgi:hypothetical protein